MSEADELAGRVALITGGASGIGRAIAEAMARRGAAVAIADLDLAGAEAVAGALEHPERHRAYRADVARSEDVDAVVAAVVEDLGALDVMVNNAGAPTVGAHTQDVTDEAWRTTVGPLQDGVFHGMRAAGRVMLAQGHGSVINIASIRSFAPKAGLLAYCAAKGAVAMMTKVAALEWGPQGVRINAVAPGMTRTAMVEKAAAQGFLDLEQLGSVTPLGGVAEPTDIADMVCYLASDRARFITGAVMTVDGGLTLAPVG